MDQDDDTKKGLIAVLFATLLAIGVALGAAFHQLRGNDHAASAAALASEASADEASVVVADGVVTFYFASAKADVAAGASEALSEAVEAAQAGKTLVLSGYHDASGDPAFNAELAKRRAMAVRDVLLQSGVDEAHLRLEKPQELVGSGRPAEARRVEVLIVE